MLWWNLPRFDFVVLEYEIHFAKCILFLVLVSSSWSCWYPSVWRLVQWWTLLSFTFISGFKIHSRIPIKWVGIPDRHPLYTAQCGIPIKWPSWRRTSLYNSEAGPWTNIGFGRCIIGILRTEIQWSFTNHAFRSLICFDIDYAA